MIPLRTEVRTKTFPISTLFLITVNIVVFFYQQKIVNYEFLRDSLSLIPIKLTFIREPQFYITLITYMFLHVNLIHLFSNLFYLWLFGINIEGVLGHLGFIYFYILTGIGAGVVHTIMNPASTIPAVGASGAVSGVLAAFLILYPHIKVVALIPVFIFWEVIRVPAFVFIGIWIIFQCFYGFASKAAESNISGIAWFAHIGGFVVGILLLPVFLIAKKIFSQK